MNAQAEPDELHVLRGLVNGTRNLRALIQSDPHRPTFHFVSPEGHTFPFDPNGAIFWKGKYHLGYIYQKQVGGRERYVWGHVVSSDLMHWTIYPDMLDIEEEGSNEAILSGGAFLSKEGVPHIIYHEEGTATNVIVYATDDELKVWKKLAGRQVQKSSTPTQDFTVFDPYAWYDEKSDTYYQISGGFKPGLFQSRDMLEWEHLGPVISGENTLQYSFEDLACPDFFPIGDKSMLLFISHTLGAQYYIGEFANDRFVPQQHGRMNWPGGSFFAVEQLRDAKGRNIIWGWITQHNKPTHLRDYGWSGIMSLPRVLSLDAAGVLHIDPPEEIDLIRLHEARESDVVLQPNEEKTLHASGRSLELKIEISGGAQSPFGIKVFASADGREETIIRYEPANEQLVIDFVRSSIAGPVSVPAIMFGPERIPGFDPGNEAFRVPDLERVSAQRAPLRLGKGEALRLDVFLDRSVIEVFANGRQAMTQMVYPELSGSTGIKVFAGSEIATVTNVRAWALAETNAY
jgi:beta-fructofuranosidase